ncbi:hypothetical protein LXA43DRAFT_895298 [Ganoderma leucocontextum]|nr:hypothetical protein LXA43DRAFT_895298 [Ganoderma leucocontextum]
MHNLFLGELRHHCMDVWGVGDLSEKTPKSLTPHTPSEQQQHLDQLFASLCKKAMSAVKRTRKDYLLAVARFNKMEIPVADPTKQDITDAIFQRTQIESQLRMPPPLAETTDHYRLPGDDASYSSSVFTREVRKQLRHDISNMVVPSWIEKPPHNFGSASHGKLKADQWRTVGTIFMVVTLVRLWGHPTSSSPLERAALTNFVHLVVPVDAATRHSMSASRAELFDQNMEAYVKGLRALYKHPLVPNHHMSLHLKPCLALFGPVYGWWSYPFERYNGILQRLNSNYKPAEMPMTFMRYFYIGANLRWLISTINWPDLEVFRDWFTSFQVTFREATRGTRFTDLATFLSAASEQFQYDGSKESILPRIVYDRLYDIICPKSSSSGKVQFRSAYDGKRSKVPHLPHNGQFVPSIDSGGVKYMTSTSGARNSFVVFRDSLNGNHRAAGQIESIFYHHRVRGGTAKVEAFVVVRRFCQLSSNDKRNDPFRSFPGLEARLYYDELEDDVRVITLDALVCHFAVLKWTPEGIAVDCIIAKSLDRVSSNVCYSHTS